jgi:hypothetical protein
MNTLHRSAFIVEARYIEQRIPQFRGNPLIEALPPVPDDETLLEQLFDLPDFSPEQREWPTYDRLQMISGLSSFLQPLERHIQLTRAFDTLMRSGYVGRAPTTASHARIYQSLYEAQQLGKAFKDIAQRPIDAQLSSALVGMSGTGKTTIVRRIFSRYPQVIYHPEHHIYQIPYLHIEAPHDGISVKGLAASILRKVDELVPDAGYYDLYVKDKRASGELLLNHCARVMHMHCVGILVIDEIQNLENAGTSKKTLMSALVSASNELHVPIVFVGTHKATDVLGLNFRQARRSSGHGFQEWHVLARGQSLDMPGEWEDFISVLWQFQWNRRVVPLDQYMSNAMYACCQGIPDVAIKLFACAQWRALLDETETFSVETLYAILDAELLKLKPMLVAMRNKDPKALDAFDDIPPLHLSSLLDDALNSYEGVRQPGADIRPGHTQFVPKVADVLVQAGINDERAISMAKKVEAEGKVTGIAAGARAALDLAQPRKAPKIGSKRRDEPPIELAPDDYRNAFRRSRESGGSAFSHLVAMGAACQLDELLDIA